MLDDIINAIVFRHRLVIDYLPGERVIEPHAIGMAPTGNVLLRAFQVVGASASGERHAWKLFDTGLIASYGTTSAT